MKLLVAVKRVTDFSDRPRAVGIVAAAALILGASPAAAQDSRANLGQARHRVEFPACAFALANGVRIEFAGVHAIERGRRVFHKLVVFVLPGLGPAPVGMTVSLAGLTPRLRGRVVRSDQAGTSFEFPHPALEAFSRGGGMNLVTEIRGRPGRVIARVRLPGDGRYARRAINRGQSCYQNAIDAD